MNKRKQTFWKREAIRVAEYLVTGGAWFWSGYAMFFVCDKMLGWSFLPAKLTATVVGLVINFLLQQFWVFGDAKSKRKLTKVTTRYIILTVVNIGIDTAIVGGLKQIGITPYIGQFISSGFFTVWNYLWYRLWVFKREAQPVRRQSAPVLRRPKRARPVTRFSAKRA